jgi:biopolymer transport protein ExbD
MTLHRRKRFVREESSVLSDLAFLLIIYFIVIAGFNINKGFLMNLPAKDSARLILREDLAHFELLDSGALVYQGQTVDTSFAESEIRAGLSARPNLAVLLTVSPACPWQNVVSFVELCKRLGVDSFSFTLKKDAGGTAAGASTGASP